MLKITRGHILARLTMVFFRLPMLDFEIPTYHWCNVRRPLSHQELKIESSVSKIITFNQTAAATATSENGMC